jgi:hypothetical protein
MYPYVIRSSVNKQTARQTIIFLLSCSFPACIWAQAPVSKTPVDTAGQKDLIDIAKSTFKIRPTVPRKEGKKVYYSLFPTTSNVPGDKVIVTSVTAGFYLGNKRYTNISSVSFIPYLNFKGRYSVSFRSNIWLEKNTWTLQGDLRFSHYPQYTWGLGSQYPDHQKLLIDYEYIRFYQNALKRIKPYFFAGIGYYMDYHINIRANDDTSDLSKFANYYYGTEIGKNSVSSGLTMNFLYDSRNNSINPLPGAYANLVYRINPGFLGNDKSWSSVYLDLRKYVSFSNKHRNVLAFWSYMWTVLNNGVPYLDLPSIGWDPYQRSGRGIEQNRYRGKTLLDFEAEYRRDITADGLFGFVLFANFNTVSEPSNHIFSSLHPAAGTGLRIKFNKRSNTNVAFDAGFSRNHTSLILSLGEAF